MRAALGLTGQVAAALSAAAMLLGRRGQRPLAGAPFGVLQAFHPCPHCDRQTAHVIHSSVCRTCTDCGHHTNPGDLL
ncbi:hypothetical protein [Kitasatospora sp. NBC_01302]|uniref:hypothetical protein n=1 Tax=Kitasatospora sp. NBC_01302 TaxID=2903575 RepID=UPI002E1649BB|nr:hypothetical protein OG294_13760 [Kitasatospora sp. NBC_01302]